MDYIFPHRVRQHDGKIGHHILIRKLNKHLKKKKRKKKHGYQCVMEKQDIIQESMNIERPNPSLVKITKQNHVETKQSVSE